MSTMRKLEKDFARADLAAVDSLIANLTDDDFLVRMGLESRRQEVHEHVIALGEMGEETTASVAMFFGGRPVIASRGIEADFGGQVAKQFQDLVSKVHAQNTVGLSQRGVVPNKAATTMHITNVVRGSFGFLFEEIVDQSAALDTTLKVAVDNATKLLSAFGEENELAFQEEVESFDNRVLETAREFFRNLKMHGATFRLLAGDTDKNFGSEAVERAAVRAETTRIVELTEKLQGYLGGVFPDAHQFELTKLDETTPIRGRIIKEIPSSELIRFNKELVGVLSEAEFKIKRVVSNTDIVRESFTLLTIAPVDKKI